MSKIPEDFFSSLPDNRLSYLLYKKGEDLAEAEKAWIEHDNNRKALLAAIVEQIVTDTEVSYTKAEGLARNVPEFKDFIVSMAEAKKQKIIERAKYAAIDCEIKLRINRSFRDRAEMKSGSMDT